MIEDDFYLSKTKVRASFEHAAKHYEKAAVLQREVGERMLNRLDLIRITPQAILDVGAGTGLQSNQLTKRYKKSTVITLDLSYAMLLQARHNKRLFNKQCFVCADAEQLPVATQSIDMVFSNLTLQWCNDLDHVFGEIRRILKPGGLFMFSTLGPDTLKELRESWRKVDQYNHVNAFMDMHDIGDALMRTNLADPVMDVEEITLTYADVFKLMKDLKTLGAHNVTKGRPRGLTGKHRLQSMVAHYEAFRKNGLLPATYEVVYGHAWSGNRLPDTKNQITEIPITRIQHLPDNRKSS